MRDSSLSFRLVLAVFDAVARVDGCDFQLIIIRSAFWPIITVAFDESVGVETRKNCVMSLNQHVEECNLNYLQVRRVGNRNSFFSFLHTLTIRIPVFPQPTRNLLSFHFPLVFSLPRPKISLLSPTTILQSKRPSRLCWDASFLTLVVAAITSFKSVSPNFSAGFSQLPRSTTMTTLPGTCGQITRKSGG